MEGIYKGRAKRIRYSIINSITLFSSTEAVELIPIIDRLFLFFQDNVGIEIRETDTNEVVFSFADSLPLREQITLPFLHCCVNEELILGSASGIKKFKIYIYNFDDANIPVQFGTQEKRNISKKLKSLVTEINEDDSDKLKEFLHKDLVRAFNNKTKNDSSRITSNNIVKNISDSDVDSIIDLKCKEAIRKILNDVFESFKGNPIIYSTEWGMIKFFTVIRYPSSLRIDEVYTAQILLSDNQLKSVNENKSKWHTDFTLEIFEKPLTQSETSLADICFKIDTVQFGLGYDTTKQRPAETEFYKSLIGSDPKSVFYVPIHVNGCPWLAIYRIIGENEPVDNWSLNYEMYSQYTLLIAEKIRLRTKEVIFSLIDTFIQDAIIINRTIDGSVNLNSFIVSLNAMMEIVSCYFPFPVPIFKNRVAENSASKYLNSISDNDFNLLPNSIWLPTVSYTRADLEEYKEKVKDIIRINADYIKASNADRDLIAASYGLSHFYGNRLKLVAKPRQEAIDLISDTFTLTAEMKAKIEEAAYEFKKIEELSELITIISKQYTERIDGAFFEVCNNDDYLESEVYDISKSIQHVFTGYVKDKKKKLSNKCNSLSIGTYINNNRPFSKLYDNLILEVVRNFDKTGASDLIIGIDSGKCCFYFMNQMSKETNITYNEDWQPISPRKFWGALYYLHLLLKETHTGEILLAYEKHQDSNKIYYKCGLKLNGFHHE